ncbi:amino acid ABC transporter substrate-binding protein, PAAT family [Acetitomaculum ruminis DSM 5522]|uniref:Amino acid ABC transporter substrate-binding protein, PAAT family n=1 Tax=Acetitomaculum ruminis DSM 5522 TaxID=1120918 RepID=A0A1I0ZBQ4_9FIRM|nr:transporter substrate-binding domain-containing protein [Acetitomaculum ruminis]SFB23055.1 amino acid ABC transporter substrate-binding protein, PAAT family [Acetitomaculum ruminis DSM 5522]
MKKKFMKLCSLVMVAAITLSLAGCGNNNSGNSSSSEKSEEDVLKVGMECAYAPFNWTQTDDSNDAVEIEGGGYASGYDVMIAKKIADGLGKKLVIVKTEWDGLSPAITSGKIDMIIAGMSATSERKETLDFSDNYYTSDLVVVVKKDGDFAKAKTINDFKGAKITAQLNTFHYTVIDQMKDVDKQTALENFPDMIVALQSGKIDGYISEKPGALSAVAANDDLSYVEFGEGDGFEYNTDEVSIAVGLKKGSELTDKVNDILSEISEDDRDEMMKEAIKTQPVNAN